MAPSTAAGQRSAGLTAPRQKVFRNQFSQKSPRALHVLNHVGGWRLAVGNWWLVAVGGGWQLAVGHRWRLAVDGSWRLAVGGPLGRSLAKKKNLVP